LTDGRAVEVPHPEFLAVIPPGRTVIVTKVQGSFEIVNMVQVSSLEVGNGSTKPPKRKK
jgi:hypothetical protein